MNKILFFFLLVLHSSLFSQNNFEFFELKNNESVKIKSRFNEFSLIDLRENKTIVGFIEKGKPNKRYDLIAKNSIEDQFQGLFNSINQPNENNENEKLTLCLNYLNLSEITNNKREFGEIRFKAFLFSNRKENYKLIAEIDTIVNISATDVTEKLLRQGNSIANNFIKRNLVKNNVDDNSYSYNQIIDFENFRKQKIPLFNSETLKDGLYLTYNDFKNQIPNGSISKVEFNDTNYKILKVFNKNQNGKHTKLKKSNYYGIVYKGKPYIYNKYEGNFTLLHKSKNDYYFVAKYPQIDSSNDSFVTMMGAMYGITGGVMAAAFTYSKSNRYAEMKIDYKTGKFILMRTWN